MIKTTAYTGDGICSLCGANKPTQQIQYTSATRKASVPICDKCFKELKPCEGCKPKKGKSKKPVVTSVNTLEAFAQSMLGANATPMVSVDLPAIVQIPDKKVSKEIEEMHDEMLAIAEEYND